MSTYQTSYKSLLQGVSQQLPSERLPGQLSAQVNMVSDPVTGIRRRPGVQYKAHWAWEGAGDDNVLAWFTDLAGSRVHILLNTGTGNIRMLDESFTEVANLDGGPYLTSSDSSKIRACAVGNEFFLCNVDRTPELQYGDVYPDPANSGFFYVAAGAFGRKYSVTLGYADGNITAEYTTPGGTGGSDASLSTPEYIAQKLAEALSKAGTATPVNMTDVRLTGWSFSGDVASSTVQRNTGTSTDPVWTDITAPQEFSVAELESQRLRVRYSASVVPGAPTSAVYANFTFQVKFNGVWGADTYTVSQYLGKSGTVENVVVPVSTFTSTTTPGAPILYVAQDGPYVFVSRSGGMGITTTSGTQYMIASQGGGVSSEGNLPARLPAVADGFICRVGSGGSPKYYRYDAANLRWLETAEYGSPTGITNVPISITWSGSAWVINSAGFEGRLAGDDKSNPVHEFMQYGITGISTYQGRLVLMSGPLVSLSASNKPRRFFRSTVTSVVNSDPIEIGSGQTSAAAYEWAVPFNKDLILFSAAYQAVIPSGNAAITPANATVVPTSGHEVDTTSSPINLGRTLMYCNPRSEDFFGVLEVIPSQYTDSQYVSHDSTTHLPKYMGGRCRFAVSSGVANMAMFAPSGDKNSLVVHEYHWNADTKDQQAWHTWTFDYPVVNAYFVGDMSVLVFVRSGIVVLGTVDARAGAVDRYGVRRAFLDLAVPVEFDNNTITLPTWLAEFDPELPGKLVAVSGTGVNAGEPIGFTLDGDVLNTVRTWPEGTAVLGVPYYSGFVPTPPQTTDYNNEIVHDGKATVLKYIVKSRNSGDFTARVSDDYSEPQEVGCYVLAYDNPELEPGRGLSASKSSQVIPARTDMRSTTLELSTTGVGELNVTSIEYVARFHPKIKRR